MSTTTSQDQSKKTSSVFEKLGQRITNIKKDIAENIERREQLHNNANNNQVQFLYRPSQSDDSLIIETKPPPTEVRQRLPSSDDGSSSERSFSISQFTSSFGKKSANENIPSTTTTTEITPSNSFQDIFLSENSDHAKDMIKNNILHEVNRRHSQALSESGSDDFILNKTDHNDAIVKPTTVMKIDKHQRKPTMLLAGPKFRYHTSESNYDLKRDVIYPVLCVVGAISIYIMLWKPLSSFFSGYFLGFVSAMAVTYIIIKIYIHAKTDESIVHEWIDFPELESLLQEKIARTDKHTSQYTCCEVVFGRYDVDRDGEFLRYPAIIHLDKYRFNIQLPTKTMTAEEKKDKEIKFVGFREYTIKGANLILVPEATLTRIKYWLNEYPIVLQNLQISNKQIVNKQFYEKSKFDANDFFNNSHTTISLFFETGPDKEDWFHKLSLVLREGKSDIEHNDSQKSNLSTSNTIAKSISDTQIPTLGSRASQMQSNTVNLENRVQMKSSETVGPPYADTVSSENSETEILRSQINEGDILSDMTQARTGAQELRADLLEKKDSDKDSTGTQRTATTKKKYRKEEESLHRLLNSPDCLDEAAITLNFLTRRLFCDIFEEPLFKDLIKEKIELKLKEIAVSVLEDLHVETIDMGNTFPVILKVEPMQWNTKGIWFNLFLFYKGNFNFTIKTRIVLQKLLNYNPIADQPMYYQHQSGQIVHKDEERQETEELIQRQKLLAKEPEIPEKNKMTQNHRTRFIRIPKQEEEVHIFSNPLNVDEQPATSTPLQTPSPRQGQRETLFDFDYQAPLTAHSLRPNSRWLIVRRNIHRIRFMGFRGAIGKEGQLPDFYLGLQMARELRRAQLEIKDVDNDTSFQAVKEFSLASAKGQSKKFDTRHVQPEDALIYDRLGEEPLSLQNLLYYFSKQDIQHGTVFWDFLNEVNHVLNLKRKRTVLVQRLRRLALSLALVVYIIIGLMFCTMVIGIITTITKMNDPEVEWMDHNLGGYSSDFLSTI
ncbi:unnamed protein product [Adineta steineri]|uniref:SMP-LTD domain-containing protein n=1 Tax=Adineta steineri TaxID=433720 RepID=A0A815DVG6_9BILA|nr:unnamed protein product [Adineta steineri]